MRDAMLFVAGVLGLALALSLATPFAFAGRTEMAVLPVWIWAVARTVERRRAARVGATAAAALGLLAVGFLALEPRAPSAATRAAVAIGRVAQSGDTLFAGPWPDLPFRLAADRGRRSRASWRSPRKSRGIRGGGSRRLRVLRTRIALRVPVRRRRIGLPLLPPGFVTPELSAQLRARGSVRELRFGPKPFSCTGRRAARPDRLAKLQDQPEQRRQPHPPGA